MRTIARQLGILWFIYPALSFFVSFGSVALFVDVLFTFYYLSWYPIHGLSAGWVDLVWGLDLYTYVQASSGI